MIIAYCFAGHLRTFRNNPTIYTNLLRRYPGDVFVHTYSVLDLDHFDCWHTNRSGAGHQTEDSDIRWLRRYWGQPGHLFSCRVDRAKSGRELVPGGCEKMAFRASQSMVHAMRVVHSNKHRVHYDMVVSVRPDLWLEEPLNLQSLELDLNGYTIFGGANPFRAKDGVDGEVFTVSSPSVADAMFCQSIPYEEIGLAPSYGYEGERMFMSIRRRLGISYRPIVTRYGLLRGDGVSLVCEG